MNCNKCRYCIQVSANEYKVRCDNRKIAESPDIWVVEPSHCVCYTKGKSAMKDWQYNDAMMALYRMERIITELEEKINEEAE